MEWYELARFWSKVDVRREAECWDWRGAHNEKGYGHLVWGGEDVKSHRVAYLVANGEIPAGLLVLHKCDRPKCCNPRHLFLGTHKDNSQDMLAKGRARFTCGEKHPKAKLTLSDIAAIRQSQKKGVELAKEYAVCPSTISEIRSFRKYK